MGLLKSSRSLPWLLCLHLLPAASILGCRTEPPPPTLPAEPPPGREMPADPSADKKGELHLRVGGGVLIRAAADRSSPTIRIVDQPELLRVLESRDGLYKVAFAGGEGWIKAGDRVRELRMLATRLPPQISVDIDPEVLSTAKRHLSGGGESLRCGPYRLLTDIDSHQLLTACELLASELDQTFALRYGVTPLGEPGETLILFRTLKAFRAFAAQDGPDAVGYAGHAMGTDGYLALYVGDQATERVIQTLVHEMTHLVSRRALGAPLPRWLSEGLADGLGDPATAEGIGPSHGLRGAEAMARRVLELSDLPDLRRLTALDSRRFDRDPRQRDYEQSAVFIRFLMSHPDRKKQFKAYLQGIARGEDADADALAEHLGLSTDGWQTLDHELRQWLQKVLD